MHADVLLGDQTHHWVNKMAKQKKFPAGNHCLWDLWSQNLESTVPVGNLESKPGVKWACEIYGVTTWSQHLGLTTRKSKKLGIMAWSLEIHSPG